MVEREQVETLLAKLGLQPIQVRNGCNARRSLDSPMFDEDNFAKQGLQIVVFRLIHDPICASEVGRGGVANLWGLRESDGAEEHGGYRDSGESKKHLLISMDSGTKPELPIGMHR
jgi:hypothetical protein